MLSADFEQMPSGVGVYLFLQAGQAIYIGKAVNIKTRLYTHLKNSRIDKKTGLIFKHADRIKTILTESELNALLLEAALIRKHKPKYNVIWKDDRSPLYIKITVGEKYPYLFAVRRENDDQSAYFGPFDSARVTRKLLREIRKIIPFCQQQRGQSPCFYAKIGLCDPCPAAIEQIADHLIQKKARKKYLDNIRKIIMILKGKSPRVLTALRQAMNRYSKNQNYEKALIVRNKISFLQELIERRSFDQPDIESLVFRPAEVNQETVVFLKRCFHASKFSSSVRIECYDISHLFGAGAAASMVVFVDGAPSKKDYRRFRIKTETGLSDIDMLREVVRRRMHRREWSYPDLLVVDGGAPQVRRLARVLTEFDLKIPLLGLAKNPDRIVLGHPPKPYPLPANSPFFLLLRRLRDESHRFARKYHLLLRKKRMMI